MEAAEGGVTIRSVHFSDDYDLTIELKSLKEFKVANKNFKIKATEVVKGC